MEQTLIQKAVTPDLAEYAQVVALYEEAFPPEERYPVELLDRSVAWPGIEYTAYFDGDLLCGFTHSAIAGGYLYVIFLAVNAHVRSRGYGTRILAQIRAAHPDCMTVLEIEPLDPAAPNNDQRLRRLAFYERNGFTPAGYVLREEEMDYAVLVAPPFDGREAQFDPAEFVDTMVELTNGEIPLEILEEA